MKPAPSIIGFTTLSGLGYGILFVLAGGAVIGLIPEQRWLGVIGLLLSLGTITAGLLSSTLHLGHPERAWRAISQWRSSWLSREGLLALLTYVPGLAFGADWIADGTLSSPGSVMAMLAALGAAGTVFCTGMIYASLPPVRAWHHPLTAPIYLAFALMSGLLAVHFIVTLFDERHQVIGSLTLLAIAVAFILKTFYWLMVSKKSSSGPTRESATGLGKFGLVQMLDPPHTQTNYLLEEMGFQIGRKHARKLRTLAYLFGLALPLVLTLGTLAIGGWVAAALTFLALASGMIGILLERWLFFAEAEHTVMLYYGDHTVERPEPKPSKKVATAPAPAPAKEPVAERPRRRRAAPKRRRRAAIGPVSAPGANRQAKA